MNYLSLQLLVSKSLWIHSSELIFYVLTLLTDLFKLLIHLLVQHISSTPGTILDNPARQQKIPTNLALYSEV